MKRWVLGAAGMAALVAVGAATAQERGGGFGRGFDTARGDWAHLPSAEDRAAFTDARIAALHAGLKLNPDQEKLWPPVEDAIRGWVKQRQDARSAMRDRMSGPTGEARDVPGMLRAMADRQAASADALRKLADATGPLYGALDDAQKRRLVVLGRGLQPGMGRHGGRHGDGRGPDRGGPDRRD